MHSHPSVLLVTERLQLFPLTFEQLALYAKGNNLLEDALGLTRGKRDVPDALAEALTESILPAVADATKPHLYTTLWTVINKELHQMVGDLCFKGVPNKEGEVEIGYGTYEQFQGRGFMTEAVSSLAKWALTQPGVSRVLAETDPTNLASEKILKKNGFQLYKTDGSCNWWKLEEVV